MANLLFFAYVNKISFAYAEHLVHEGVTRERALRKDIPKVGVCGTLLQFRLCPVSLMTVELRFIWLKLYSSVTCRGARLSCNTKGLESDGHV